MKTVYLYPHHGKEIEMWTDVELLTIDSETQLIRFKFVNKEKKVETVSSVGIPFKITEVDG